MFRSAPLPATQVLGEADGPGHSRTNPHRPVFVPRQRPNIVLNFIILQNLQMH
jgi:hypothetical protein